MSTITPSDRDWETIIIDEFANNFQYHYALRILAEPGVRVETKGGTICLYAKRIVITAMDSPLTWWSSVKENRYALYRRIHYCYRFCGNARNRTQVISVDEFPFEFESDPEASWRPRLWIPVPPKAPTVEEMTAISISTPEELPRFSSGIFEWDTGSTENENESLFFPHNAHDDPYDGFEAIRWFD